MNADGTLNPIHAQPSRPRRRGGRRVELSEHPNSNRKVNTSARDAAFDSIVAKHFGPEMAKRAAARDTGLGEPLFLVYRDRRRSYE